MRLAQSNNCLCWKQRSSWRWHHHFFLKLSTCQHYCRTSLAAWRYFLVCVGQDDNTMTTRTTAAFECTRESLLKSDKWVLPVPWQHISKHFFFVLFLFFLYPPRPSRWVSRVLTANKPLQASSGTQLRPALLGNPEARCVLCSVSWSHCFVRASVTTPSTEFAELIWSL